jgi:hypothetical protein
MSTRTQLVNQTSAQFNKKQTKAPASYFFVDYSIWCCLSFELDATLSRDFEFFLLCKCPGTKSSTQTINFRITFRNCSQSEHKCLQNALILNQQPRAKSDRLTKARSSIPASCPVSTQLTPPTIVLPRKESSLLGLDSSFKNFRSYDTGKFARACTSV